MVLFINSICFLVTSLAVIISLSNNKDLFSPIKLYSIFNLFFYAEIYSGQYSFYVSLIYLCQCLVILILCMFEPQTIAQRNSIQKHKIFKLYILIWAISLIPIFSQIIIIKDLGGIVSTIENIAYRVQYFKSKGYLAALNYLIVVLNLTYYWAITKENKTYTIGYILHFFILIFIGILSGSRSFIIMTCLSLLIIYNYNIKLISISKAITFFIVFAFSATLLGTVRNTIRVDQGEIDLENVSLTESAENSHFRYGLIPLDIITRSEVDNLQYGKTYISLLTNFIPRSIFPEKLESGGIFFTKYYADNAWGGDSNLATGTVTEGIINFGYFYGTLFGLLLLTSVYYLGIVSYKKIQLLQPSIFLIPYIYLVLLCARFSYSEFSYIIFNYTISILVPFLIIYIFSTLIMDKNAIK